MFHHDKMLAKGLFELKGWSIEHSVVLHKHEIYGSSEGQSWQKKIYNAFYNTYDILAF